MAMIDSFLQELEHEAKTTRRVLERVPDHQLGWRPHPKSRTLGELALHVAGTPGEVAKLAAQSEIQAPDFKDARTAVPPRGFGPFGEQRAAELNRALDGADPVGLCASALAGPRAEDA